MNRITDVAVLAETVRQVLPAGYALDADVPTGGGCRAMKLAAPDGRQVWITDGDADLPFSGTPEDWPTPEEWGGLCLSYYDERAGYVEPDGWLTAESDAVDVENVQAWIRSWVDGHPYRDAV